MCFLHSIGLCDENTGNNTHLKYLFDTSKETNYDEAWTYSVLNKVFTPLELFHILSYYNHKCKCILMGFYVIDQHKVMHNCEVEGI